MANPESEFILGNKAKDLLLYTMQVCANDKVIPKRMRFTLGNRMEELALSILEGTLRANEEDLRVNPAERFRRLQRKYIDAADGLALGHQTSHNLRRGLPLSDRPLIKERLHMILRALHGRILSHHESKEHCNTASQDIRGCLKHRSGSSTKDQHPATQETGIDFAASTYLTQSGQVVRKLRRSSEKRIKRHMKAWEAEYHGGEVTQEKIMERFQSWEAHAKHGDTRQLREEMKKRVLKIFETEKE
jgi:hypothetical protein